MMETELERLKLTEERAAGILEEDLETAPGGYKEYFTEIFGFIRILYDIWHIIYGVGGEKSATRLSLSELKDINSRLFTQISPENYEKSFTDPDVAAGVFGTDLGQGLCAVAAELRGAIPALTRAEDLGEILMRSDLALELYSAWEGAAEEEEELSADTVKGIFRSYYHDYYAEEAERRIRSQLLPEEALVDLSEPGDTGDIRELYETFEYVSDNEIRMYEYLCSLDKSETEAMARTYTEGYIKGFEVTGRDLSIKETAELRFNIGFIPMMRYAAANLKKAGLATTRTRAGYSIFTGRSVSKNGVFGGNINPQFDIDHKNDLALILDEELNDYRLECTRQIYESLKTEARNYAGPAVVEIFGEPDFEPRIKETAADHDDRTRALVTAYAAAAGQMVNEYIPGDERSFTIIAYPVPSIGPEFENILKDTIRINTLDYMLYREIQQKLIDALDKAEYVHVTGRGKNRTELMVHLHTLTDPDRQTNFENCVADVNIPVGEVFTSPLLKGTKGLLHVTHVFLNGLEYHDLSIRIEDGMIKEYHCQEGDKLIEDNILYHHDTLPMGECAIGTNTTAYEVGRRYAIESKLPILIAEKTGPHFAFGDTCYSHCEDLAVFNPDGKEIIARDNECSLLRKTEPGKAYFNCHTDITIPYDELGSIEAVCPDGSMISLIGEGRFVLPGCETLNEPLDK